MKQLMRAIVLEVAYARYSDFMRRSTFALMASGMFAAPFTE